MKEEGAHMKFETRTVLPQLHSPLVESESESSAISTIVALCWHLTLVHEIGRRKGDAEEEDYIIVSLLLNPAPP